MCRVVAPSGGGTGVAHAAATGNKGWTGSLWTPVGGGVAGEGDHLVVVTLDNQAIALSTVDGKTQWQTASTVETSSLFGAATPAIAFDTVVVGFSSGELMAMWIENSRPVWRDPLAKSYERSVGKAGVRRGRYLGRRHKS